MTDSNQKQTILHLTDYGAPYAGNFIASLSALEELVDGRGGSVAYVLPPRARERAWAQDFSQSHEVRFLEAGGFLSYYRQVRRFLRETNASILHEHFIHFSEKIAAWLAILTCGHRVKTVLHLHNHITLPKNPLLRELLGGYDMARRIHFYCMAVIVGFVAVHIAMVVLVPRSLLVMLLGRSTLHSATKETRS